MERAQKAEVVGTLNQLFKGAGSVVVAHYAGLNVADMTALRAQLREAGAAAKVAKNRLVKRALEGTEVGHIADLFNGPTVIVYGPDPVVGPKVAVEFAKTNDNLVILGGAFGETTLTPKDVEALAALPSLDTLRGMLAGLVTTPATRIAHVVAEPAAQMARVLSARAEQGEAA